MLNTSKPLAMLLFMKSSMLLAFFLVRVKTDMLTHVCQNVEVPFSRAASQTVSPHPVQHKNAHLSLLNVTWFIIVHSTSLSKSQSTVLEHVNYSLNGMSHGNLMRIRFTSSSRSLIKVPNRTGPSTVPHL